MAHEGRNQTEVTDKVTRGEEKVGRFNHDMNFINYQCKGWDNAAIKNKQLHGYNILSNI